MFDFNRNICLCSVQCYVPHILTNTDRRRKISRNNPSKSYNFAYASWSCPDCEFRLDQIVPYFPMVNCTIHIHSIRALVHWIEITSSGQWTEVPVSKMHEPLISELPKRKITKENIKKYSGNIVKCLKIKFGITQKLSFEQHCWAFK